MIQTFRILAERGCENSLDHDGNHRFTVHIFRVSGAPTLSAMRIDLYKIEILAGWKSLMILHYARQARLSATTDDHKRADCKRRLEDILADRPSCSDRRGGRSTPRHLGNQVRAAIRQSTTYRRAQEEMHILPIHPVFRRRRSDTRGRADAGRRRGHFRQRFVDRGVIGRPSTRAPSWKDAPTATVVKRDMHVGRNRTGWCGVNMLAHTAGPGGVKPWWPFWLEGPPRPGRRC